MIVVGVDGSDACQAALGFAFEVAAERGAELTIVHVARAPEDYPPPSVWVDPDDAPWEQEGRALVDHALAGWLGKYPDVVPRPTCRPGHPVQVLRSTRRPPIWSSWAASAGPSSPRCDSGRCLADCCTTPGARWRSSTPKRRRSDGRPARLGPSPLGSRSRSPHRGLRVPRDIRRNRRQNEVMTMLIRDLMTTPAVSVTAETPIGTALRLLDDQKITAMPVVDRTAY